MKVVAIYLLEEIAAGSKSSFSNGVLNAPTLNDVLSIIGNVVHNPVRAVVGPVQNFGVLFAQSDEER